MEKIEIEITKVSEKLKDFKGYYLKSISYRKTIVLSVILLLIGVYLLFTTINSGYDIAIKNFKTGEKIFYNYNFMFGIGIGFLLISINQIIRVIKIKNLIEIYFFKRLKSFENSNNKLNINLTENEIHIENHDSIETKKWEYFSEYKILEKYILIFSKYQSNLYPSIVIPTIEFNNESKQNIVSVLSKKLYKK